MRISQLVDRRVALLGFGVEGQATLQALRDAGHRGMVYVLGDVPPDAGRLSAMGATFVAEPLAQPPPVEVVIRSPGFAPRHRLRQWVDGHVPTQTTATDLFMHEARAAGLCVVGVTGSKGKSTTSTVLWRALQAANRSALLMGNIGVPPLGQLARAVEQDAIVVLELSSYQCADLSLGPNIGLLLTLFPEHMDWHGGVDAYYAAKLGMLTAQRAGDRFFYGPTCAKVVGSLALPGCGRQVGWGEGGIHFRDGAFFRGAERLFGDREMRLPGLHNRFNACCAMEVLAVLGADLGVMPAVLRDFAGLPYRLQDEGIHGGVRFINDSISTAPEATVAALSAFGGAPLALIVGGFDRGYAVEPLLDALRSLPLAQLVAMPETGRAVASAVRQAGLSTPVLETADLQHAIDRCRAALAGGGVCLFSPGAPSYGAYSNFAERGAAFTGALRAVFGPPT